MNKTILAVVLCFLLLVGGLLFFKHALKSNKNETTQVKILTTTSWQWEQTKNSDGSVTAPPPTDQHKFLLTFKKDGQFSSTTDCNQLQGTYEVDQEVLSLDEISSTLMGCLGETKENVYRQALEKVVSYHLQGDILTLTLTKDFGTMQFKAYTNHPKEFKRIFQGVLPCADCPGIKTTLTFTSEGPYIDVGNYILEQEYLDRGVAALVSQGKWTVIRGAPTNPDATVYSLDYDKPNEETYYLQVDATHIRQLANDLTEINSNLNFTLKLKKL